MRTIFLGNSKAATQPLLIGELLIVSGFILQLFPLGAIGNVALFLLAAGLGLAIRAAFLGRTAK